MGKTCFPHLYRDQPLTVRRFRFHKLQPLGEFELPNQELANVLREHGKVDENCKFPDAVDNTVGSKVARALSSWWSKTRIVFLGTSWLQTLALVREE